MRKRKWLLIVILVLILINIIFWSISYFFDINNYVEKILTERVGRNLNADITFSQLNITSKILQISDLMITERDGAYSFRAKQLYIQFSFWKLVFNNFDPGKALKEIRCFSPELVYKIGHEDVQTIRTIDVNAIEKALRRFDYISIINGSLQFMGEGKLQFDQTIEKLNITLENQDDKQWIISANAHQKGAEGTIAIQGVYERSSNNYTVTITDYLLDGIKWSGGEISSAKINADIQGTLQKIDEGMLRIENVHTDMFDESLSIPECNVIISQDTLRIIQDADIDWKGNSLICTGKIIDYFRPQPEIDLVIEDDNFDIGQLSDEMNGMLSVKMSIKGPIITPQLDIEIRTDSLKYEDFTLNSLYAKLQYNNQNFSIKNANCSYMNNFITADGHIEISDNDILQSKVNLGISSQDFIWKDGQNEVTGDADVAIFGSLRNPKFQFDLSNLTYENKYLYLYELDLSASLLDEDFNWVLHNPSQSIVFRGNATSILTTPSIDAELYANDLAVNSILRNQIHYLNVLDPHTQTNVKFNFRDNTLTSEGFVSFPDYINKALNGQVDFKSMLDIDNMISTGFLEMSTDSFMVNNVAVPLYARVDLEHESKNLQIMLKDIVEIQVHQYIHDSTSTYYKGFCIIDSAYIAEFNTIYPLFGEQVQVSGILDGEVTFDTSQITSMTGNLAIQQFGMSQQIHPVDIAVDIAADSQKIILNNLTINNSQHLLKGEGYYHFKPRIVELVASGEEIKIEDFLLDVPIEGIAEYHIILNGRMTDPTILFDISINNGRLFATHFDALTAQFFQDDDMFCLNNLDITSESFSLQGSGSYSYNFMTEEFYNKPDEITFSFKGDIFKELEEYIPEMRQASSTSALDITLSTEETTTLIDTASFKISRGQFSLKGQPERIKDFSLDAYISNNILTSLSGSFKMGDGKLFMDNQVSFVDSDIYVGSINFGTLRFWTDEDGITIHIPEYQPERAMVDTRLEGFENEYFMVYNQDGAWILDGRIILSNGNAIYKEPDDVEKYESLDLGLPPIHAKFDLVFEKNTWYVASPFNLKIDNGNYMSFRTDPQTDDLQVYFDLHSRQGDMRLFGEIFSAEDVSVRKTRTDPKVIIDGEFIKRTPDGSTIYLYVQSTEDKLDADDIGTEAYGDVKVTLESDNPKDVTMLSILSKIQYGKEIDDLSEEERYNLGREQVINLASDELSDLIFNPLISPVEGAVRQFLGLDFVRVRPGIMRNIIETSGIVETDEYIFDREFESDLELIGELSRDILLENLTIDLGKYITPDWYLNYEALIKKEMTARNEVSIGVQHEFSLTWDLPYNFRFKYKYQFNPARREDNQGISLETVFHF